MALFWFFPEIKLFFEQNGVRKNVFYVYIFVGVLEFLCVRWTLKLKLAELFIVLTRTRSSYFMNSKYLDYMQQ